MELKELKELIKFISRLDVGEFEIENGDLRIYMSKNKFMNIPEKIEPVALEEKKVLPLAIKKDDELKVVEEENEELVKGYKITAPIVGTFYEAHAPGSEQFARVGDIIKKGQPLCIIEAMKVMNEIEADFECKILKQLVKNGESVEFGQVLYIVESLE
jgi:acetyl-CoA carboxylase biotin carboxyl carrier protein